MLTLDSIHIRETHYRDKIRKHFDCDDSARASYLLANLALEELVDSMGSGIEPSQNSIDNTAARLDHAAVLNTEVDPRLAFRAKLLKTWMLPIIWSNVINLDGLTDTQAKRVVENIGLAEAADRTAELTAEALHQYDEIRGLPLHKQDGDAVRRLVGAIGEATPILLGARPNTAKQFALPALAYDNSLNTNRSMLVDGFYYDNRRARTTNRNAYQVVNGNHNHFDLSSSVALINGQIMGNLKKSSKWPNDDRAFGTTRRLVTERRGKKLSTSAKSTLDRIASEVFNTIRST